MTGVQTCALPISNGINILASPWSPPPWMKQPVMGTQNMTGLSVWISYCVFNVEYDDNNNYNNNNNDDNNNDKDNHDDDDDNNDNKNNNHNNNDKNKW